MPRERSTRQQTAKSQSKQPASTSSISSHSLSTSSTLSATDLASLQQTIGNQAVQRLLESSGQVQSTATRETTGQIECKQSSDLPASGSVDGKDRSLPPKTPPFIMRSPANLQIQRVIKEFLSQDGIRYYDSEDPDQELFPTREAAERNASRKRALWRNGNLIDFEDDFDPRGLDDFNPRGLPPQPSSTMSFPSSPQISSSPFSLRPPSKTTNPLFFSPPSKSKPAYNIPLDFELPTALTGFGKYMEDPDKFIEERHKWDEESEEPVGEKSDLLSGSARQALVNQEEDEKYERKEKEREEKREKKKEKKEEKRVEKQSSQKMKGKDEKGESVTYGRLPDEPGEMHKKPSRFRSFVKGTAKRLGKAKEETAKKVIEPIAEKLDPVVRLVHTPESEQYHSLEEDIRENWQMQRLTFLKLFHTWVKELRVPPEHLWGFIQEMYPNLANFCTEAWGIVEEDLGIVGSEESEESGLPFEESGESESSWPSTMAPEKVKNAKVFSRLDVGVLPGTSATLESGVKTFSDMPSSAITEIKPSDPNMGDAGSIGTMATIVIGLPSAYKTVNALQGLYNRMDELQTEYNKLQREGAPREALSKIESEIERVKRDIKANATSLAQTGVGQALGGASIVAELTSVSSYAGPVSLLGVPLQALMLHYETKAYKVLRDQKNALKRANRHVPPEMEHAMAVARKRMNKKMRDKRFGIGTGAASTTTSVVAGGLAITGLAVGGAFSFGVIPAAVLGAIGLAVVGKKIKTATDGYRRGKRHIDWHGEMNESLTAEDPDLARADELALELQLSDPQVASMEILNGLMRATGENRKIILDWLVSVGLDQRKYAYNLASNSEDAETQITFYDILKILKK